MDIDKLKKRVYLSRNFDLIFEQLKYAREYNQYLRQTDGWTTLKKGNLNEVAE